MKTALLALALLVLAPPDLVTVLAEKQRRAIYDFGDAGLESFVAEFAASEWKIVGF